MGDTRATQKRYTNVAVVRIKRSGKVFEIAAYKNKVRRLCAAWALALAWQMSMSARHARGCQPGGAVDTVCVWPACRLLWRQVLAHARARGRVGTTPVAPACSTTPVPWRCAVALPGWR